MGYNDCVSHSPQILVAPKLFPPDHSDCHAGVFHRTEKGVLYQCPKFRPAPRPLRFSGRLPAFIRWLSGLNR